MHPEELPRRHTPVAVVKEERLLLINSISRLNSTARRNRSSNSRSISRAMDLSLSSSNINSRNISNLNNSTNNLNSNNANNSLPTLNSLRSLRHFPPRTVVSSI